MTIHIGEDRRLRALQPSGEMSESAHGPRWLIRGVAGFCAVTALSGVGSSAWAFAHHEWRLALVGSTLLIMSVIAGSVLVGNQLLADRQEFYRRGELNGWMRGWRGQEPEAGDPLLRQ
ncbi:hypothetical protein Q0Z83_059730 [Actinoplanes sichuanensis]|uniref:Uncharacterized protein n=1 Tax=Actinoplanes sichuanensis TaxID=512349 RepID=A0ABW4A659_9ACTN|nr:hypothetical protein [Actinoplanes sichuanensis]BEL07782.1 hypothetical protein Q0Z83_059730 [Actinoplanes sichuanensis]